jgi:hypothetical protein
MAHQQEIDNSTKAKQPKKAGKGSRAFPEVGGEKAFNQSNNSNNSRVTIQIDRKGGGAKPSSLIKLSIPGGEKTPQVRYSKIIGGVTCAPLLNSDSEALHKRAKEFSLGEGKYFPLFDGERDSSFDAVRHEMNERIMQAAEGAARVITLLASRKDNVYAFFVPDIEGFSFQNFQVESGDLVFYRQGMTESKKSEIPEGVKAIWFPRPLGPSRIQEEGEEGDTASSEQ